jgi:hypothetical protein
MDALLDPYRELAVPPAASWVDIPNAHHQLNRRRHHLKVSAGGVQRCAADATSLTGSSHPHPRPLRPDPA